MLLKMLPTVLGCLLTAQCREMRPFRSPTISGSWVNLGKVDISVHFNSKEPHLKTEMQPASQLPIFFPKPETIIEEPCPCHSFRGGQDGSMPHPSDILNRIFSTNDLFSFDKVPTSSTLCCESHEHTQEDIVTLEMGPKNIMPLSSQPIIPKLPFILENMLSKKQPIIPPLSMPMKQRGVEIFLFPKKKDNFFFNPFKNDVKKNNIKIVGDKEIKNDFKIMTVKPIPVNLQSSVKKDLTAQEKTLTEADDMNEPKQATQKDDVETTAGNNPNSLK